MEQELRKIYLEQIKDMNIDEAISHINDLIFNIDMIDIWDKRDKIAYEILCDIKRNLQKGVIK